MTSFARRPPAPHTLSLSHSSTSELTSTSSAALNGSTPSYTALAGSKPLTLASLLETPIEFTRPRQQTRDDDKVPYKPINQRAGPPSTVSTPAPPPHASTSQTPLPSSSSSSSSSKSLFPSIDPSPSWSRPFPPGSGLQNVGNTCYLNSTLQCLLHTPPLVRYLMTVGGGGHPGDEKCPMKAKKGFCMTCAMRGLVKQSYGLGGGASQGRKSSYTPGIVVKNLKAIAKHLRLGRQEDSHEFLRFVIDGMQLSSLHGKSPKLTPTQKNQNPIHQLFGGTLRSRVHCTSCLHNSDTFDAMLDLSLDLGNRATSLKDGLDNLVRVDHLRGQNKYKCEKCKKLVNAEKQFTIEKAPLVLTIHLKRFTPTGRKVSGFIKYPETLNLKGYMSDGTLHPCYKLYALILHSGSGPHSGHYTSLVKSGSGKWFDMNDDLVSPVHGGGVPLSQRNAYCLFYVRDKGDKLREVLESQGQGQGQQENGLAAMGKKRKRDSLGSQSGGGGGEGGMKVERSQGEKEKEGRDSPVGKKVKNDREVMGGPTPPQVLTTKSLPSSPKLASTTVNPFEPATTTKPSDSTSPQAKSAKNSLSDLERKALAQRMEKQQHHSNHKKKSKKEFQSRNASSSSGSGGANTGNGTGGGGGFGGKKQKLVNKLMPRNKPRKLEG